LCVYVCYIDLAEVQLVPGDWETTCWVHLIDGLYEIFAFHI